MAYDEGKDATDSRTSRESVSDDLEGLPLTGDERRFDFHPGRRRWLQWPANDSPFWKFYSLFITTIAFVSLLTAVHENTKPKIESKCPATGHNSMPLEYTESSPSELHTKTHHSHSVDNRLDGYPLGKESYKEDNIVTTKFYRDLRYMTLDHEADYLWEEHLHMVTGNIKLPPAEVNGNASMKAIAMFHQMHCLAAMRSVLQKAREGEAIGKDETDDFHWPHCFDYLRMSILCFADSTLESITLEPGPVDDGKVVAVIDGGADTRYCRNSNPLYMLERRYGPNSQYGYTAHHGS